MEIETLLGVLLYVCGGVAGSAFYLPFRRVRGWSWESYWMIYAVTGLVVAPIALAAITAPTFLSVLRATPLKTLSLCFIFGAAWGVGGLTWGIMLRYLGVGLGMAIGSGLCAAVGTLLPPIYQGQIADLFTTASGQVALVGVAVCVLGIIVMGLAGMSKEKELPEEQKKLAVADYNFPKGLVVAIVSGVMSAGMFLRIRTGDEIVRISAETGLISPGILLIIPDVLTDVFPSKLIMPDSEVVYSPTVLDFDVEAFIYRAGGCLSNYQEGLSTGLTSGAEIVKRVCIENSVNPKLILALLEFKSHWVYGQPTNLAETDYPMGYFRLEEKGLYRQLSWAVSQLSIGYYGWRAGNLTHLPFKDGSVLRMSPGLNAGSAAIEYLLAQWFSKDEWLAALDGDQSLAALMERMYGSFKEEFNFSLYSPELTQPKLELPFVPGRVWAYTGGPHSAWGPNGASAALDFAPPSTQAGCVESREWVTAMAAGVIVRSENGTVIQDLDDDKTENTGWNLFYMHIATQERVAVGTRVEVGDPIGHPSCEGGISTGTHVHVARKYNGEWILDRKSTRLNSSHRT